MSMFWEHDRASVGTNPASLPYLTLPNQLPTPLRGVRDLGGRGYMGGGSVSYSHKSDVRMCEFAQSISEIQPFAQIRSYRGF